MKTQLTTFSIVLLTAFEVLSQSTVNFNNTVTTFPADGIDRSVYSSFTYGTKLVGQNWAAALYWGTSADSINNLAVLNATDTSLTSARALFRVATTASPGTWSGGARTLLGTTPGQALFLQVRVWDINLYANYDLAKAAGSRVGQSTAFAYTTSSSPTPPPSDLVML